MVITEELMHEINTYIERHKDEAMKFYKDLVEMEGRPGETENLRKEAEFLNKTFTDAGLECQIIEAGGASAPIVIAETNKEGASRPIVFMGHYDTVYPSGSWKGELFRVDGDRVYGPGVTECKGGIVIALYTIKALMSLGFTEAPLKIVLAGDEEACHEGSDTVKIIEEHTTDILVCFCMDERNENGAICIGRMGSYEYKLMSYGVSAHSGKDFDEGVNAVAELAKKVVDIQALTSRGADRDFTVSVNKISGGSAVNQIPAYAEASVDLRVKTKADVTKIETKMRKICEKPAVRGAKTELELVSAIEPFETTKSVVKAYNSLKAVSDTIQGNVTGTIFSGGSSDAAYVSQQGEAVLSQCGVMGDFSHSNREEAVISSLWDGIRLFVASAYNWRNFI
ncbi:MAG: M20/M25/M40 family metallo-hydrolase [Eubacterium sp.]|jgi:glutamate carboxypeptidase